MIFQDNIAKKYLQIHSRKYGILNNFYFYCKESFIYNKLGFILSLFLVPAGIIKSVTSIFIPKLVIDSLESFRSEYTFLINIIIVTVVIAVSSIVELLAKNTMEHNMNSFVLIQLNKLEFAEDIDMKYKYMRIQGREDSYVTKYPKGVFSLCWNLIRDNILKETEKELFISIDEWFKVNLPEPEPCINHEKVITFFKCESTEEMLSKLEPAIALLDKYEKAYDVVYTNFVGTIVYEDNWQVAVKVENGRMV